MPKNKLQREKEKKNLTDAQVQREKNKNLTVPEQAEP